MSEISDDMKIFASKIGEYDGVKVKNRKVNDEGEIILRVEFQREGFDHQGMDEILYSFQKDAEEDLGYVNIGFRYPTNINHHYTKRRPKNIEGDRRLRDNERAIILNKKEVF